MIYLDSASTTPISKKVKKAMIKAMDFFYNPSSLYPKADEAKIMIDKIRTEVAGIMHAQKSTIVFTAGGTESINIAICGVVNAWRNLPAGRQEKNNPPAGGKKAHIITTSFEHSAVRETINMLVEKGEVEVSLISPMKNGVVDIQNILKEIKDNTVLVTMMLVNNELGTIQPVRSLAVEIIKYRKEKNSDYPYIHTDACQAPLSLPVTQDGLQADLITLDAQKMYGPKGSAILYVRESVYISSPVVGGGQEKGLRSGTENIVAMKGFAEAHKETTDLRNKFVNNSKELKNFFIEKLDEAKIEYSVNGSLEKSVPHILNICIPNLQAEFAVVTLGSKRIMCSAFSACAGLDEEPKSIAVESIGKTECIRSSLRFSFGRDTSRGDIKKTVKILKEIIPLCSK